MNLLKNTTQNKSDILNLGLITQLESYSLDSNQLFY